MRAEHNHGSRETRVEIITKSLIPYSHRQSHLTEREKREVVHIDSSSVHLVLITFPTLCYHHMLPQPYFLFKESFPCSDPSVAVAEFNNEMTLIFSSAAPA